MHSVNRLHFEARCSEEEQAFALRSNFALQMQAEIAGIIDSVCSEYIAEDEWLQIDHVEIDLGRFTPQTLSRDFAAAFRERFTKELLKKRGEVTHAQRKAAKQQSQLGLFCFFILHGVLPWWANPADTHIDKLAQELCAHTSERVRAFFYQQRNNQSVWSRAALQLNRMSRRLVVGLFKELDAVYWVLSHWTDTRQTAEGLFTIPDDRILDVAPQVLLRNAPDLLDPAQAYKENTARVFAEILQEIAPEWNEDNIQTLQAELQQSLAAEVANNFMDGVRTEEMTSAGVNQDSSVLRNDPALFFGSDESENAEPQYRVHHAGMVLLAPFFSRFFSACGLQEEGIWKDKDAQYRAVQLLKYVCTGETKTPEYALTLEKLCCGIALDEPIPLDIALQEQQIEEAQALLSSVITHWKVLKNTSMDGLRETFLKRDGLITRKNRDWLLQVERKTLDVLLDSIPWGYSTIALPWNDYLIHVEW